MKRFIICLGFCLKLAFVYAQANHTALLQHNEILPEVKTIVKQVPILKTGFSYGDIYDSIIYKSSVITLWYDSVTKNLLGSNFYSNEFNGFSTRYHRTEGETSTIKEEFTIILYKDSGAYDYPSLQITINKHHLTTVEYFDAINGVHYDLWFNKVGVIRLIGFDNLEKGGDYYFYPNGRLNFVINKTPRLKNGDKSRSYGEYNGLCKAYHANGQLKTEIVYKDGEKETMESAYDSLGKKQVFIVSNSKGDGYCNIPWTYLMEIYPDTLRTFDTNLKFKNFMLTKILLYNGPEKIPEVPIPNFIINSIQRKTKVCKLKG